MSLSVSSQLVEPGARANMMNRTFTMYFLSQKTSRMPRDNATSQSILAHYDLEDNVSC